MRQEKYGSNRTINVIFIFLDECLHSQKLISIIGSNLQGSMIAMQIAMRANTGSEA